MPTFTAGLRCDGLTVPFAMDGLMDGPAFRACVEKEFVPSRSPGDIVIMNNLPAHKNNKVSELIEAANALLVYLPSYSPDLNPIEMAF